MARGLEDGGVLSVSKHFPGHGDTDVDSHKSLPVLPFTRERLDSVELYPFRKAVQAGGRRHYGGAIWKCLLLRRSADCLLPFPAMWFMTC